MDRSAADAAASDQVVLVFEQGLYILDALRGHFHRLRCRCGVVQETSEDTVVAGLGSFGCHYRLSVTDAFISFSAAILEPSRSLWSSSVLRVVLAYVCCHFRADHNHAPSWRSTPHADAVSS